MKKTLLILLALTGIIDGCRYEDGPLISFRSVRSRIYGNYTLTQYKVNGIDSINLFKDSLSTNFTFLFEDHNDEYICNNIGFRNDGKAANLYCRWGLKKNNNYLWLVRPFGANGTGPFGNKKETLWEILRLTDTDLKMQINYNDKEYFVELKKNI